jgi:hypothetical protein
LLKRGDGAAELTLVARSRSPRRLRRDGDSIGATGRRETFSPLASGAGKAMDSGWLDEGKAKPD